ncbi:hypothetical protein HV824_22165 [Myxococcus sp. AM009]|uniref:hypothetical protein n=1 Tax=Myxococcus sp. AM009 TaxID=2745137 RepID=UPI001595A73F|nr:hypothetical protein [Myxococcus sp. AM009]NVJ00806.1 hypothetical protein [Myxococcus sp. AM009]
MVLSAEDQWDSRALLSLILVGLPELESRMVRRYNRSLYSRLYTRLRIETLTPEDTAEYLRVRLARAGCDRELFASDALAMLHEAASGALKRASSDGHQPAGLPDHQQRCAAKHAHGAPAERRSFVAPPITLTRPPHGIADTRERIRPGWRRGPANGL